VASNYHQRVADALEPFVYELVGDYFANFVGAYGQAKKFAASHQGSVSSEHGIGSMKIKAMKYSKDEISRQLMKKFKDLLDGRGIMNPGKVLE
jgi:(R)-2-hydroxyglutarate---pyruvate transhydrogenase